MDYDYAILHLTQAFTPGINAAVGTLVDDGDDPISGTEVIVSGFGNITGASKSQTLLKASLNIMDRKTCSTLWTLNMTERVICAHSTQNSACHVSSLVSH